MVFSFARIGAALGMKVEDYYGPPRGQTEFQVNLKLGLTPCPPSTPNYLKLLRLVRDSGMRVIFAGEASRKIELGSVSLTVLPQPVQKRETLGGEAGPLERRGCYAPSSDCTVFRGNYCL